MDECGEQPGRDLVVRLTGRVAAALAADERLRGQHLSVQVQHGVAILNGVVDDAALHDVVTGHARRTPGIRDLCDGLGQACSATAASGFWFALCHAAAFEPRPGPVTQSMRGRAAGELRRSGRARCRRGG